MDYSNSEMKLDQLIGYFNAEKINLIPPFQRGTVWNLQLRQKLLENMIAGRPIPAIFLYKEPAGSQFAYNILDGKQRLESLILFIGDKHPDMKVNKVKNYFFQKKEAEHINFTINNPITGKKVTFSQLPEDVVRNFREYAIPTIEIDLDESSSSLDEIIGLFIDINQYGKKVARFDIVKAMGLENKLLGDCFDLIAQKQVRKLDIFYKKKNNIYTRVLQHLQAVESATDPRQNVDRMWERLVEIALFSRKKIHRQPGQILKAFIQTKKNPETVKLKKPEKAVLHKCFNFLDKCYDESNLGQSRLGKDQPHFYTMISTLISSDLLAADGAPPDYPGVRAKLVKFADLLTKSSSDIPKALRPIIKDYLAASVKQTTHPSQRDKRQEKMLEALGKL